MFSFSVWGPEDGTRLDSVALELVDVGCLASLHHLGCSGYTYHATAHSVWTVGSGICMFSPLIIHLPKIL